MFALTNEIIQTDAVRQAVQRPQAGATIVFEGVTRNHHDGRTVKRLEYEAYEGMAEAEMAKVGQAVRERWPQARTAIVHRVGVVPVGQVSVVIATSAPHRDTAYAASRFAIDTLKNTVPIWKREVYEDGSVWKANQEARDAD